VRKELNELAGLICPGWIRTPGKFWIITGCSLFQITDMTPAGLDYELTGQDLAAENILDVIICLVPIALTRS
jgi:hypothetical protein